MGDIIVRNQEVIIKLILAVIVGGFTWIWKGENQINLPGI